MKYSEGDIISIGNNEFIKIINVTEGVQYPYFVEFSNGHKLPLSEWEVQHMVVE